MKKALHSTLFSFFILLFLSTSMVTAAEDLPTSELYGAGGLTLNLGVAGELQVVAQGGQPVVESLDATLHWVPAEDYRQRVDALITQPRATSKNDALVYHWTTPTSNVLQYRYDATLRTSSAQQSVTKKYLFPLENVPSDVAVYTLPGEIINVNDAIRDKAFSLAGNEDDLFKVVYAVADWVTSNIKYELTSVTADATKPSTWVYEHRTGVCDEMTALFVSMLRSLGIPAKFISGVSYTNLPEFPEPWGGHGWAEVWFPEVGWVPFDVTYGTYGYVDATHVKLQESVDAGASSVDFEMLSREASLVTKALDLNVEVLDVLPRSQRLFTTTLEVFDNTTGLSSYNMVTARVKNNVGAYVSARLQLGRTEGLEPVGELERNVLLEPYGEETLYFIMHGNDLERGFLYDFPIKLYAGLEVVGETTYSAREGFNDYDESFFTSYLKVDEEERPYNDDVDFTCEKSVEAAYLKESVSVECTATNHGAKSLKGVKACLNGCSQVSLAPGEERTFSTTFNCESPGLKASLATLDHALVNKNYLVNYQCVDKSIVNFADVNASESIPFDGQGTIAFLLRKESESVPRNLNVSITHDNFEESWLVDELVQPQAFTLTVPGSNLDLGANEVTITVSYEDALGKTYETATTVTIRPDNFSLGEKLQVHLLNFQRWIESLFS